MQQTPQANIGKAEGHGFDMSIDLNHSFTKDFWITGRANFTYSKSKYKVYEEPDYSSTPWRSKVGRPISQQWGYVADFVVKQTMGAALFNSGAHCDQVGYYKYMREQTAVPFAMGELFTNPAEWKTIIQNQWIDFIRVHLSDIGGITPAVKLAHFCDAYGVRTAWHGPNDLSPIGMCAQMHLDLNSHNFGIQEFSGFTQEEEAVFPGCPKIRDGYGTGS